MILTREELRAIIYHLNYDIQTISENLSWEEVEQDEKISNSALKKLKELLGDEEIKVKETDLVFRKETKRYVLEMGDNIVKVEKWWVEVHEQDDYEIDYEILSVKRKGEDKEIELGDEELDKLCDFITDLD